jgi:ABC-type Fe3+ transport system permease subunit
MKRIRKKVIAIVVIIIVSIVGNFIFNIFVTDKGLENSAAAFAGNQGVDVVDALTSSSLITIFATVFNAVLGILFLYFIIRLIITSVALYKEHQNLNKIIKEEL